MRLTAARSPRQSADAAQGVDRHGAKAAGRSQLAARSLRVLAGLAVVVTGGAMAVHGGLELLLPEWGLAPPPRARLEPAPRLPARPAPLLLRFTVQVSERMTWRQLGQRGLGLPDAVMLETMRCHDRSFSEPDAGQLDLLVPVGVDIQVWLARGECDRVRASNASAPSRAVRGR